MVTSPAFARPADQGRRRRRSLTAFVAAAVTGGLLCGLAPAAMADPLSDRHDQIKQSIAAARQEVDEGTTSLQAASDALAASQQQLTEARSSLDQTRANLQAARDNDAVVAARLAQAQAELERARAAVAQAQADVAAQRAVTAQAAREAYQGRGEVSNVVGLLESKTLGDLQQRLQWDTTIFGSTTAKLTKLQTLEAQLAEAEKAQAAIEAQVAADKKASEENVAAIATLEASATQQEADLAALVTGNEQDQSDAQKALDEDTAHYNDLVAEDASIQSQLARRAAEELAQGGTSGVSAQGFIRPTNANPGSPFGRRFHPILKIWRNHNGTDFGAACGTPLYAAQSGTVVSAARQGGFGNYVVISHGVIDGASIMTGYAHQSKMVVSAGQKVTTGQLIGYVGTTGLSTGCHLHLQVYKNGTPVNPMTYIP